MAAVRAGDDRGIGELVPAVFAFGDVEELLIERGVSADHTTVWRWV